MAKITVRQAINQTIISQMRKDEDVILFGEDVAFYGGSLRVTAGLYDEFGPERVLDTPLAETVIAGCGVGSAMMGLKPIAEITYIDFTMVCMDQILNQAAKWHYMTGGNIKVPLVIRTQGGGYRGNGAQHSQCLESFFTHLPGMVVICPSSPSDFIGLLNSAIEDDNPVMFVEHKLLYNTRGEVSEDNYDFKIPFGVADIKREGKDVTIVAYSYMVIKALEAASILEKEGIDVEIVDPRTLNPFDYKTVYKSIEKTGRAVIVSEAHDNCSFTKQIATKVNEEFFGKLKTPVKCVGALNIPIPYAQSLEEYVLPSTEDIVNAVKETINYNK